MRTGVDVDMRAARAEVDGLVDRAVRLRPLFDTVVDDFHRWMGEAFATGGKAIGRDWRPDSPGWAAVKARRGAPSGPGVFTGMLAASLTSRTARHAKVTITGDTVRVSTSAPQAPLFDAGRRSGQPARPLLPSDRRLEQRWAPLLAAHLAGTGRPFDGTL